MQLTESLASTAAQTLPIFALAATLEVLAIHHTFDEELRMLSAFTRRRSNGWRTGLAAAIMTARWLPVLGYLTLILYDIRAERLCLRLLAGDQSFSSYGADVEDAMFWSFVLIAVIPIAPVFVVRTQTFGMIKQALGLRGADKQTSPDH